MGLVGITGPASRVGSPAVSFCRTRVNCLSRHTIQSLVGRRAQANGIRCVFPELITRPNLTVAEHSARPQVAARLRWRRRPAPIAAKLDAIIPGHGIARRRDRRPAVVSAIWRRSPRLHGDGRIPAAGDPRCTLVARCGDRGAIACHVRKEAGRAPPILIRTPRDFSTPSPHRVMRTSRPSRAPAAKSHEFVVAAMAAGGWRKSTARRHAQPDMPTSSTVGGKPDQPRRIAHKEAVVGSRTFRHGQPLCCGCSQRWAEVLAHRLHRGDRHRRYCNLWSIGQKHHVARQRPASRHMTARASLLAEMEGSHRIRTPMSTTTS